MKAYFNDLSCADGQISVIANIDKVVRFLDLLNAMKKWGLGQVIIDRKPSGLKIGDIRLAETIYDKRFFDKKNLIDSIINYLVWDDDLDRENSFTYLSNSTTLTSLLLGNAAQRGIPAVSFAFSPEFEVNAIAGMINEKKATVANYHRCDEFQNLTNEDKMPMGIVSEMECRLHDPVINPLWNKEATAVYHKSVKSRLDTIKTDPTNKIAVLKDISGVIARLNGWELDSNLSKINSSKSVVRRIYRSAKFKKTAYLSVDFEKPDVHFELFSKRPVHLGEYRWDGTKTGGPSPSDHKIVLKKAGK